MAAIFLSYSRQDAARVSQLAAALTAEGHEVWWDKHIGGGQEFADEIEQALNSAEVVVVVWSENSVGSAWVRDEAAAGRDNGRLVPVTLDGCAPPLGFRQYQTIDLSKWNGRARAKALDPLKAAVAQKASGEQSAPATARPQRPRPVTGGIRKWAVAALAAVVLIVGVGLVYTRGWAGGGTIAAKVALGELKVVSPGLPAELPQILEQEMLAAFGAENLVTVVARDASAPFVMDGSVSKLGDATRYTMNLRNQGSGAVLWSTAYDHEAGDAFAPRQVAVAASQIVRCGLWGASSYKNRMSDQALSLYLKFCNEHWSGSASETGELDAARQVVAAVPDFSFGWSALALAAVPLSHGSGSGEAEQLRKQGWDAAQKSIDLDGSNPEGYMAMAGLLPPQRYAERERLLKKAISVRPTECGCERQAYGDFLASVGRMEEAAEQYERARAMRPLAPFSNVRFAQALYVIGRNDEADGVLTEALRLWPQATSLRLLKMKSALWTGEYDGAVALLRAPDLPLTSVQRDAMIEAFEALQSQDAARRQQAAAALERFSGDPRRNDRIIVAALAALGAREAALQAAANLVRTRGLLQSEILFEPNLADARGHPHYAALVRSLGLVNYWRSGNVPDVCRDAAKPIFCSAA